MPSITLLTDFQDGDGFTGILKGVFAGIAPATPLSGRSSDSDYSV